MDALIKTSRAIILGGNLLLAGADASISRSYCIEAVVQSQPGNSSQLVSLEPDFVNFDLTLIKPELLLLEPTKNPGMLLFGIDPENHEVPPNDYTDIHNMGPK
jgi:hypothetical protein